MKMVFTEKEMTSVVGVIRNVGVGITDSFKLFGQDFDELAELVALNGLTDEAIKEINDMSQGIVVITRADGIITIDYNEEYVVATVDLTSDFITDFFDVIKYSVKTFIAFGAIKFKKYEEKVDSLIKNLKHKTSEK